MSKRKPQVQSTATVWPYTPEPSPHLKPEIVVHEVEEELVMANEDFSRSRPMSVTGRREGLMSPGRPTLEDVLNNTAPPPYTLAAYTAFLSQQHCLETLEFVTEARKYSKKYDEAAANLAGMPLTIETDQGFELIQDWSRLLDIYVKPGAPREINLPSEERDQLIEVPYDPKPPLPETLNPAVQRMYDLMSDSIFIPFCNSLKAVPHAQTFNALVEIADRPDFDPSRTYDERATKNRMSSKNRRSPPNTSAPSFEPRRSPPSTHRQTQSSSLTTALGRNNDPRLSTHISHSSAMSEAALTDSSGSGSGGGLGGAGDSPLPGEQDSVMTPPTTPPTSDLGAPGGTGYTSTSVIPSSKTQRSESGGWKKSFGMKFFGGGKVRKTPER